MQHDIAHDKTDFNDVSFECKLDVTLPSLSIIGQPCQNCRGGMSWEPYFQSNCTILHNLQNHVTQAPIASAFRLPSTSLALSVLPSGGGHIRIVRDIASVEPSNLPINSRSISDTQNLLVSVGCHSDRLHCKRELKTILKRWGSRALGPPTQGSSYIQTIALYLITAHLSISSIGKRQCLDQNIVLNTLLLLLQDEAGHEWLNMRKPMFK